MDATVTTLPRDKTASAASSATAASQPHDPLSDALIYLAAHHGRALSRNALLAGLPITDGRLTVPLLTRAASAPALRSSRSSARWPIFRRWCCRPMLIMRDGSTLILLQIDQTTHTAARSIQPRARRERSQPLGGAREPTISATHSSSAPRRSPIRAPSPPAICRASTGSGRSSAAFWRELRPRRASRRCSSTCWRWRRRCSP